MLSVRCTEDDVMVCRSMDRVVLIYDSTQIKYRGISMTGGHRGRTVCLALAAFLQGSFSIMATQHSRVHKMSMADLIRSLSRLQRDYSAISFSVPLNSNQKASRKQASNTTSALTQL